MKKNFFLKLLSFFKDLKTQLSFTHQEKLLAKLLKNHKFEGDGKILVEIVEDHSYLLRFIYFLLAHRKLYSNFNFSIDWVNILIPFRRNRMLLGYLKDRVLLSPLKAKKWHTIYLSLGGRVLLYLSSKIEREFLNEAKDVLKAITASKDLDQIKYRNIRIGDLIYDTYLRFKSQPTVNLNDPFLLEVVAWAIKLIETYEAIFTRNKYEFFLTTYTSYIHHGIAVRVAMDNHVPVYAVGTAQQLVVQPSPDFPYHQRNFNNYKSWYKNLDSILQVTGRAKAKQGLQLRISGQIDPAISYMKESAYRQKIQDVTTILPPKAQRKTILILAHDFFDSPHVYGNMSYPDFYLWLNDTLSFLETTDHEVLVKPHPNATEGNKEILAVLKEKYKKAYFLPQNIISLDLIRRGVDLAVTVHGTVAHEFAFLGVKIISVSDNPHSAFDFGKPILNRDHYLEILKDPCIHPLPAPEESEAFYFIHNYRTFESPPLKYFPLELGAAEVSELLDPNSPEFEKRINLYARDFENRSGL